VLGKNDYIRKAHGPAVEDIEIVDQLREVLVVEESDNYCIYSEADRSELLFALFQLVAIGGHLNQYEDYLGPYRDATRELYKLLVNVRKDPSNDQMFVDTQCYSIKAIDGKPVFPEDHPQHRYMVIVQPFTKICIVLRHRWQYFS
jgi:cilia- and flagella-associated protein 300